MQYRFSSLLEKQIVVKWCSETSLVKSYDALKLLPCVSWKACSRVLPLGLKHHAVWSLYHLSKTSPVSLTRSSAELHPTASINCESLELSDDSSLCCHLTESVWKIPRNCQNEPSQFRETWKIIVSCSFKLLSFEVVRQFQLCPFWV